MQEFSKTEEPAEHRLSSEEVRLVLERLHGRERESATDPRPTPREISEAMGVPAEAVLEAIRDVREDLSKARTRAESELRRRRRRVLAIAGATVAAAAVILNLPMGGGTPMTVSKVEVSPGPGYHHGMSEATRVEVELDYHAPTLWRYLFGPKIDEPFGLVTLNSPRGARQTFGVSDGGQVGVQCGAFYRISGNRYHIRYAYPRGPETAPASGLAQPMKIDGVPFDLQVSLP